MSQDNVERFRQFMSAVEQWFDDYWREPFDFRQEFAAPSPRTRAVFAHMHPDAEWQTVFLGRSARGFEEMMRTWEDFLVWAEDYRPRLEDATALGPDQVFAVIGLTGRTKGSAQPLTSTFYDRVTFRDGMIARVAEYVTREEALTAGQKHEAEA